MPGMRDRIDRFRAPYFPDQAIGDLLAKPWIDNIVPFIALAVVVAIFGSLTPDFFALSNLSDLGRQVAEFGLLTLGLTIVVISGGIDLSVGQVFSLAALFTLLCINVWNWSVPAALGTALALGVLAGAVNGVLIGYLRLRAFLTTLVTLIIYRSFYELVFVHFETALVSGSADPPMWDFLGTGSVLGLPASLVIALVIVAVWHLVLSRMRPGWRLTAVGGARRSAYNAGINVRRTVFSVYVWSGTLAALAGFLFAARLGSVGSDTGTGLEVSALTAVVLGGNSLGGGRGSVVKAMMGALFVLILNNSLINFGVTGPLTSLIFGCVLITAVLIDMRWMKGREKWRARSRVSPALVMRKPPAADLFASGGGFAQNEALGGAGVIGLGLLEGPGGLIFDAAGHLYCGTRRGDILRLHAPNYREHEIFAHVGGHPLGMEFDSEGRLILCVAGMGLYAVETDGAVIKLSDEVRGGRLSLIDGSRLRFAHAPVIVNGGQVYFTESSIRHDIEDWSTDAVESRPNGRLLCFDPASGKTTTVLGGLAFPSGLVLGADASSLFFAESWACRICRFWFEGPHKGRVTTVMSDLPGYPVGMSRASAGGFWVTMMGMRGPAWDLALEMPGVRRRMVRQLARDLRLSPNVDLACIARVEESGQVLQSLWQPAGHDFSMLTTVREDRGTLFFSGIAGDRIGTLPLAGMDARARSLPAVEEAQA